MALLWLLTEGTQSYSRPRVQTLLPKNKGPQMSLPGRCGLGTGARNTTCSERAGRGGASNLSGAVRRIEAFRGDVERRGSLRWSTTLARMPGSSGSIPAAGDPAAGVRRGSCTALTTAFAGATGMARGCGRNTSRARKCGSGRPGWPASGPGGFRWPGREPSSALPVGLDSAGGRAVAASAPASGHRLPAHRAGNDKPLGPVGGNANRLRHQVL